MLPSDTKGCVFVRALLDYSPATSSVSDANDTGCRPFAILRLAGHWDSEDSIFRRGQFRKLMATVWRRILIVDLVVDMLVSLLALLSQEIPNELESFNGDDESGGECGLAGQEKARAVVSSKVLVFARVDINHVVPTLKRLGVGKKDKALCLRIQLAGRLLDNRPPLVDFCQGLVAEVVRLLDIWLDILVGLGQIGQDGGSKGLVGGVAELKGSLAVGIRLEGLDAVVDDRVARQVLCSRLARSKTRWGCSWLCW